MVRAVRAESTFDQQLASHPRSSDRDKTIADRPRHDIVNSFDAGKPRRAYDKTLGTIMGCEAYKTTEAIESVFAKVSRAGGTSGKVDKES